MYQISPRDFSNLNREINNEIEKVLLKFVHDGKIKVIPNEKSIKSVAIEGEKRKRGRPRKVKTDETKSIDEPKRKRGRPKKVNN